MSIPEKTRVQRALEHMTLTTEQSRKAAVGGQVGGSVGALTGTVTGAAIGATTAYASRGRLNRVIGSGERSAKQVKAARKKLRDLKTPAERATTGAFLGAGSGTALGGGAGAAAGLYSGRPGRPRDGDGDGQVNEGKVKKAYKTEDGTPFSHRVGETNRQFADRFDRSSRVADKKRKPYDQGAAGLAGGAAATAYTLRNKPKAAIAAGAAGLIGAGAISGTGSAKHRKTFRDEMSKAYDESKHRRDRGKFAPKSGMTEAPGARKPRMPSEQKKKALANSVAALGVAGSVADAAALKAGWAESKNTVKPTLAPNATRRIRTLARAKYVAGKGSFPLQVVGLGAGLGGSYFARQAGKNQEKNVAKSFDESKLRRDANGRFSRQGESKAPGSAVTLAGMGAAGASVGNSVLNQRIFQRDIVNAAYESGRHAGANNTKGQWRSLDEVTAIRGRMNRANAKSAALALGGSAAVVGGAVMNRKATERRLARQQAERREKTVAKAYDEARHSRADDGKFARQRGNSQRRLTNQRKNTQQAATTGAGLLAAGEIGGLAAERARRRTMERGNLAVRVANTSPGAQWLTPEHRKKARDIAGKAPMKAAGLGELRGLSRFGGRVYGGLALTSAALAAADYRENKRKHEKKYGPVTKSLESSMSAAPDVHELFAKARERKQYEASTGAQIGGAVAGGLGTSAAGSVMRTNGVRVAQATPRGSTAHAEAVKVARLGQKLKSPKAVGLAAGAGALAGTAATFREKKVQKSFDTADEVFSAVAKFEKETKRGAKNGAMILGGINAVTGLGTRPGAYAAGLAGGAVAGGAIGAGVGGIQARNRQKKKAPAQRSKTPQP